MDILGRNRAAEELTQEIDAATDVVKNTETGVDIRKMPGGMNGNNVVRNTEAGTGAANTQNLGNVALRGGSTVQFGFGGERVQPDWQGGNESLGGNPNGEFGAMEGAARSERSVEKAEQELAKIEAEVAQPEKFVGEETSFLEKERQQEDLADLRREENLAPSDASETERGLLASEHKIVRDVSKAVTMAAMQEVEDILREKVVHPADLANLWQKRSIEMISKVDGYALGDNN